MYISTFQEQTLAAAVLLLTLITILSVFRTLRASKKFDIRVRDLTNRLDSVTKDHDKAESDLAEAAEQCAADHPA